MICHVDGLGSLVPDDERWLTAGTDGRVDQILLRPGARVRPNTVILQLSNPDLDRQITDAELAMKKSEAELANLRVQLQAQLLNEKALEAQLQSDAVSGLPEPAPEQAGLRRPASVLRAWCTASLAPIRIRGDPRARWGRSAPGF